MGLEVNEEITNALNVFEFASHCSTYGIFRKNDVKERLHGLSESSEIASLGEIPPQDRAFVLEFYRLFNAKRSG